MKPPSNDEPVNETSETAEDSTTEQYRPSPNITFETVGSQSHDNQIIEEDSGEINGKDVEPGFVQERGFNVGSNARFSVKDDTGFGVESHVETSAQNQHNDDVAKIMEEDMEKYANQVAISTHNDNIDASLSPLQTSSQNRQGIEEATRQAQMAAVIEERLNSHQQYIPISTVLGQQEAAVSAKKGRKKKKGSSSSK